MSGTLSIVATPIGNLKDITLRALETLRACDMIVCEDTRVTSKLLAGHQISKPLRSLHEHTSSAGIDKIVEEIKNGKMIVYVSDAGTPGVNDPGGKLVEAAYGAGVKVEPLPGPSALSAAISVCGFPMDEFTYLGFVPHKKGRQTFFAEVSARKTPSVFFESTHRIEKALDGMEQALNPSRVIFVGRELTKLHETLYRGTVPDIRFKLQASSFKGEFVIIVGPAPKG